MVNTNYKVEIIYCTNENLSKREQILLRDTSNCIALDKATCENSLVISPSMYAILSVHNEKAKGDKDFEQYIIVDKAGTKYVTGSKSFIESFRGIFHDMVGEGDYEVEIYQKESKNYTGKNFITCSIV